MEKEKVMDWEAEYICWQKSGLSQRRYSEAAGYSLWTFKTGIFRSGCRKRLKKTDLRKKTRFVALKAAQTAAIAPEKQAAAYCEIRFNGKPGLRIESAETMDQLRTLVKGLWG